MNNSITGGLEKVKNTSASLPFDRAGIANLFSVNVTWCGEMFPFLKLLIY